MYSTLDKYSETHHSTQKCRHSELVLGIITNICKLISSFAESVITNKMFVWVITSIPNYTIRLCYDLYVEFNSLYSNVTTIVFRTEFHRLHVFMSHTIEIIEWIAVLKKPWSHEKIKHFQNNNFSWNSGSKVKRAHSTSCILFNAFKKPGTHRKAMIRDCLWSLIRPWKSS